MATTIFIHYCGSKAQSFRSMERAFVYMDDFVYRDFDALGLPRPHREDCMYKAEAGVVKCWFPDADRALDARLDDAFTDIRRSDLDRRSITILRLSLRSMGGRPTFITAPGVRHPSACTPRRAHSSVDLSESVTDRRARRFRSPEDRAPRSRSRRRESPRPRYERDRGAHRRAGEAEEPLARTSSIREEQASTGGRYHRDRTSRSPRRASPRGVQRFDDVLQRLNDIHSSLASEPSTTARASDHPATPASPSVARGASPTQGEAAPQPTQNDCTQKTQKEPIEASIDERKVKEEPREDHVPAWSDPSADSQPPRASSPSASPTTSMFSSPVKSSEATSTRSMSGEPAVEEAQRALQEICQQMSALAARRDALTKELEQLTGSGAQELLAPPRGASPNDQIRETSDAATAATHDTANASEQRAEDPCSDDEVEPLRAQLQIALAKHDAAVHALRRERRLRVAAESALADVRRECAAPFVAPALVDVFTKICALTDDLL